MHMYSCDEDRDSLWVNHLSHTESHKQEAVHAEAKRSPVLLWIRREEDKPGELQPHPERYASANLAGFFNQRVV